MKILCVPPKTLSRPQIEFLKKNEVFCIVTDQPEKIFFLSQENQKLKVDDVSLAALKAMSESSSSFDTKEFLKDLYKRCLNNETGNKK